MINTRKSLVLYHCEDPDGVISAVLLTRALGSDLICVPVGYYNIVKQFEITTGNLFHTRPESIYVSDLGINDHLANSGRNYGTLEQMARVAPITWFDHHPSTERHLAELKQRGINFVTDFTNKKCASVLVQEHFNLNGAYHSKLVSVALTHDLNQQNRETAKGLDLQKIISIYLHRHLNFNYLVRSLVEAEVWEGNGTLNPDLNALVLEYDRLERSAREQLCRESEGIMLSCSYKNGFTIKISGYGESFLSMKDTGRFFLGKFKDPHSGICAYDAYIVIRGDPINHVLVCTNPDFSSSFDPVKFCQQNGGGGRGNIGGFNFDGPITTENFEEVKIEVCRKLEKYLNSE